MGHIITVHQLRSLSNEDAFLNVNDEEYGYIEVWGSCFKQPVYLAQKGIRFHLLVFENEKYCKEWLEKNSKDFDTIIRITEILQ